MICKACGGQIPEGRRGRFCSEKCRRGVDVAGAGSAESGASGTPHNPAPDFNRAVKELPPLTAAELRKALAPTISDPFKAKYPGTCERCGGRIKPGQEVHYRNRRDLEHDRCRARREDAALMEFAKPARRREAAATEKAAEKAVESRPDTCARCHQPIPPMSAWDWHDYARGLRRHEQCPAEEEIDNEQQQQPTSPDREGGGEDRKKRVRQDGRVPGPGVGEPPAAQPEHAEGDEEVPRGAAPVFARPSNSGKDRATHREAAPADLAPVDLEDALDVIAAWIRELWDIIEPKPKRLRTIMFCLWAVFRHGRLTGVIERSAEELAAEFGIKTRKTAETYLTDGALMGILRLVQVAAPLAKGGGTTNRYMVNPEWRRTELNPTLAEIGLRIIDTPE